MKTITVLAYNRPDYLERCLDALSKCRGIEKYGVVVSVDAGGGDVLGLVSHPASLNCEVVYMKNNYGIDHHNARCYNELFTHAIDFNVALEDDVILTPDALEIAEWFFAHPDRDKYLFCSLGDPHYRKEWPIVPNVYREIHECRSIYTSAWCFTRASWEIMSQFWNRPLKTQLGWDWSLSYYAMHALGWKSLYPLLSRAVNIGREGVHSHAEFFDKNIAPAIYSLDQYRQTDFEITYRMGSEPTPEWITQELAATEDRYAHLRNK